MKAVGIILAGGNNSRMQELSNKRAIAAMPIGGRLSKPYTCNISCALCDNGFSKYSS